MTDRPLLRASDFYTLGECDRKIYLRHHGDRSKMAEPIPFDEWLAEKGRLFEQEVLAGFDAYQPQYRFDDLEDGYDATLELMSAGVRYIYQGVLLHEDLVGIPDLLERVEGASRWGGYTYRPIDVKLASKAKKGHRLQVMAYIALLESLQGVRTDGSLFLRDEEELYSEERVEMDEPLYGGALAELRSLAAGEQEPRPFICSTCKSCAWRGVCMPIAERTNDISLIPRLRRKVWAAMHERGMGTLGAAAAASKAQLINIKGVGETTAEHIIHSAQALSKKRVVIIGEPALPEPHPEDVFFDIESVPTEDVIYLLGTLVGQHGAWQFVYDIAPTPAAEEDMWRSFLTRMSRLRGAIYHYGYYERTALKQLNERYPDPRTEGVLAKLVDIEKALKRTVAMPVSSYSLKTVARELGFEWTGETDNAADSMVEYDLYQQDGDPRRLDRIVQYNADDCYATVTIRDWLLDLVPPF